MNDTVQKSLTLHEAIKKVILLKEDKLLQREIACYRSFKAKSDYEIQT